MSKKRARRGRTAAADGRRDHPRSGRAKNTPARLDFAASVAGVFLAVVLAGSALSFDTAADASFDAPKRLVFVLGTAAAALAAFGFSSWNNPWRSSERFRLRDERLPLTLASAAIALAGVSAALSPHRAVSLDTLRVIAVGALLVPLGASRVVASRKRLLTGVFLGSAAINASVSVLQARGIYQPFPLVTSGARNATGAFAGNVGYLALTLALAAVLSLGLALTRGGVWRIAGGLLTLLFVASLVVNQNLTSLSALAVGAVVLLFGRLGRRAIAAGAAGVLLLAVGVFAYGPMRVRVAQTAAAARAGDWDRLLSYRTAPWAAAVSMAEHRPFLGFGPGTFEAEFVAHRLEADIVHRRRLVNPLLTSTYAEAHCDYLQPFAEEGLAAGLAITAAAVLLLAGSTRSLRGATGPNRAERLVVLALLAAGATAALTWFPMQRPITAAPLLLAAGRGWRLWRDGRPTAETP